MRAKFAVSIVSALILSAAVLGSVAGGQTLTMNDSSVLQASPSRVGLNIGSVGNFSNNQVYKNLLAEQNFGFEPFLFQEIWTENVAGTSTKFTSPALDDTIPANRFVGATYTIVESTTAAKGCTGKITASTAGAANVPVVFTLGTPCAAATSPGDTMLLKLTQFPTTEAGWQTEGNGVGASLSPGITLSTDSTTPYDGKQSLLINTKAASNTYARLVFYFDNNSQDRWVNLDGTYKLGLAAKLVSGSVTLTMQAGHTDGTVCTYTFTPTNENWENYSGTCSFAEGNSPLVGVGYVYIKTAGSGVVDIDDAVFEKTSPVNSANTSVFRDEVVAAVQDWCQASVAGPSCTVRDWLAQNGETLDNWIEPMGAAMQSASGRGSVVAATGASYTPRLQDFLELVKLAKGVPYLEIPVTFTAQDAADLVEFLASTNTSSGYGAKRAALGQTAPWVGPTGVFPLIYTSFCNECWNSSTFLGQNMPFRASGPSGNKYYDYSIRAGSIFAAMRASTSFSSAIHLGFALQEGNYYLLNTDLALMAAKKGAPDYIEQAAYTGGFLADWETEASMWTPALQEPYFNVTTSSALFLETANYIKSLNLCGATGKVQCVATDYEQANGTVGTCGVAGNVACASGSTNDVKVDQTHLDSMNAGAAQGVIAALQGQLNLQYLGLPAQNYFGLTEYSGGNEIPGMQSKLYGAVVDMGGACSALNSSTFGGNYCPRPQFLTMMLANRAIIGSMMACPITGTPTFNFAGDKYNGLPIAVTNVPYLYAFCYKNAAGDRTISIINTNLTTPYKLTFAGLYAPMDTVTVQQFASSLPNTLNEAATGASTAATTASLYNTTTTLHTPLTMTVPADSVTTLSYPTDETIVNLRKIFQGLQGVTGGVAKLLPVKQ